MPRLVDETGLVVSCIQTGTVVDFVGTIGVSNPSEPNAIHVDWQSAPCDSEIVFTFRPATDGFELIGERPLDCARPSSTLPLYITFIRPLSAADVSPRIVPDVAPTPSPVADAYVMDGVHKFVAALQRAGATVRTLQIRSRIPPPALFTDATVLCVNSERIPVYSFPSAQERARVTDRIDADDPSDVGDGSILWAGPPWYWERDRIVVVYVFGRAETQELLTTILGEPFARAPATGGMPPADPC